MPDAEAAAVAASLEHYLTTVSEDRLPLLARYAVHDVAFRVVGTGSIGTRSYVVLLLDHRGEPLVLQVKEARASALLPHLATAGHAIPDVPHEGRRVVLGQKRMQVVSDILLGWTTVEGRPFQVRQFRNRKGSVDPAALAADQVDDYARMTGALLARAHTHTADPASSPATAERARNWTRPSPPSPWLTPTAQRRTTRTWCRRSGTAGWPRSWGSEGQRAEDRWGQGTAGREQGLRTGTESGD